MEHGQDQGQLPTTPEAPAIVPPVVSEGSLRYLSGTRPWVKLFSILMFISVVLMVIGGLAMMVTFSFLPKTGEALPGPMGMVPGIALGGIYIAMALLYLFPAIYLSRYAKAIARLQATHAVTDLEQALGHQKSFWKFVGVMTVVFLVFAAIAVVAAITIPLVLMLLGRGGTSSVTM